MHGFYCRRTADLFSNAWENSSRRGRRAFTLADARPQYAPDRSCDVEHIALALRLDVAQKTLSGTCTTTLMALSTSVSCITLDAVALQITRVHAADGTPLRSDYDGQKLRVYLDPPISSGAQTIVTVEYSVTRPRLGLYFIAPDVAYPDKPVQVWTQCQDEDARYWFPCFDAPNERATSEIMLTVPQPYFVLSNGRLLSTRRDDTAGTLTYHWLQDKPHATYLMTLVVGEFSEHTVLVDHIPVQWYVPPGREADGQRAFGDTPAMLQFFTSVIGIPYPWDKYAQIAVSDFVFGGMENTSATTQTDLTLHDARAHLDFSSNGLVAHELAHQWFGNLLTCKHWSHAWLNEGFATYFDALFHEHHLGTEEFRYLMHQNARAYFREDAEHYRRAIVTHVYQAPIDLFDHHLYEKGALVLHMLRYVLGDALFWRAIHQYVRANQQQSVETVELERAVEAVSGRNLQAFFKQWVYQGGHPEYQVEFAWDETSQLATVTIRQQQRTGLEHGVETPVFDMPVTLFFALPDGEQRFSLRLNEPLHVFHLPLAAKPHWMSFDPGNWILKKVQLKLPQDMLMAQLAHDPDPMGRIYAADALGSLGSLDAVTAIQRALSSDPFWGVQAEIATVLGNMHTPEALQALLAHVSLPHPKARRAVVTALGEFQDERAATALSGVMTHDQTSYFVEAEAAAALGKTRQTGALEQLQALSQKPSWNDVIRAGVCRGLAELKDDRALPLLVDFTAYGRPGQVRYAAIRALGKLGSEKAVVPETILDVLTTLLDEEHFRTRMGVLDALETLQSPKTLPVLQRLSTRDLDGRVKRRLEEVINTLRQTQPSVDELQQLRNDVKSLQTANSALRERLDRFEAQQAATGARALE